MEIFTSCNFKSCENVTDNDIIGYYISCNPTNKNKQYVNLLENHIFIMVYCKEDSIIEETGNWNRFEGCNVTLNGMKWINISQEAQDTSYYAHFIWVRGKLSMGDDYWSFQKTWLKPKLSCE
jgi:hypothetical protein